MTGIPLTELFPSIRAAHDEWIDSQLRKIESLYSLHLERTTR